MRNVLAILAAAVLVTLGTGWYRDWYKVQRTPSGPGSSHFHVAIHTDQIFDDVREGLQKSREGGEWLYARARELAVRTEATADSKPVASPTDAAEESSAPPQRRLPRQ